MKIKELLKKIKSLLKSFFKNKMLPPALGGVDSLNIGAIFVLAITDSFKFIAQLFVLPIVAGTSAVSAILQTRKAYVNGKKDRKGISNAVAAIVTAIGVIIAVLMTLIGQSAYSTIAPPILTAALSAKALYELVFAGYHWYKYFKYKNKDPEKAAKYLELALNNSVSFLTTSLSAAAVGTVLIAHKFSFAGFGIASGIIGAAYAGYSGYKLYQEYNQKTETSETENVDIELKKLNESPELTNNALLHSVLAANEKTNTSEPVLAELTEQESAEMNTIINTIAERTWQRYAEKTTENSEATQANTPRP